MESNQTILNEEEELSPHEEDSFHSIQNQDIGLDDEQNDDDPNEDIDQLFEMRLRNEDTRNKIDKSNIVTRKRRQRNVEFNETVDII